MVYLVYRVYILLTFASFLSWVYTLSNTKEWGSTMSGYKPYIILLEEKGIDDLESFFDDNPDIDKDAFLEDAIMSRVAEYTDDVHIVIPDIDIGVKQNGT